MATYTATLLTTWTRPSDSGANARYLLGGLGGGYFLTSKPTSNEVLETWTVTSPGTATDTDTLTAGEGVQDVDRDNTALTWLRRRTATSSIKTLSSVTQSSGAATVTDSGTWTSDTSTVGKLVIGGSPAKAVYHQTSSSPRKTYGLTTSSAAVDFTLTWSASHTGSVIAMPAADRVLIHCTVDGQYELWQGTTATQLDTLALVNGQADFATCRAIGGGKVFFAEKAASSNQMNVGVIDTAGDSLTWTYGPTTVSNDWGTRNPISEALGNAVTLIPNGNVGADASMYVYDCGTGTLSTVATSAYIGTGGNGNFSVGAVWVDASTVVIGADSSASVTWSAWTVTAVSTGPTYLRQRQSPVRTPSRVRAPQLRQRQRPETT